MLLLQAATQGGGFVQIFALIFFLGFFIGIWILIRKLVLWYYKIDEKVNLQKRTNELLEELIKLQKEKINLNNA